MFSTQWRDEDEEIIDNEAVIQLACWASGVYDKQTWYSGDVNDDVWELIEMELADAVTARIEAGTSWNEAVKEAWREAVNDAKDGHDYVIFPANPIFLYYFYRPAALVDGALTGMRFHIGPHR